MTESGSPDSSEQAIPAAQEGAEPYSGPLSSTISHQILTLIGTAFLCFEIVFIEFYFDNFWFSIDLSMLGIPAILLAFGIALLILRFAETELAASLFSFLFKGNPLVVFRKWLTLNQNCIVYGNKHIRWESVDELELTWFGNLVIRSRLLCGSEPKRADIVLKFPFAAASFETQDLFLAAVRSRRPAVLMNNRLTKGRNPAMQKGAQATQLMTASLMTLLLLDVGFSSFYFLEMLKNYYLAETTLRQSATKESELHFSKAEKMRLHPLPISWVSGKFLKNSSVAAGIWEQRAQVLWLQGHHSEAIADSIKAIEEAPKNLRHRLFQTRLLVDENRMKDAYEQLDKIIEDHKHSLMPRLYILAISKDSETQDKLLQRYKTQLDYCFEDTYEDEPHWPPGGDRFFTELFYSDDLRFVFDRFVGSKYQPTYKAGDSKK